MDMKINVIIILGIKTLNTKYFVYSGLPKIQNSRVENWRIFSGHFFSLWEDPKCEIFRLMHILIIMIILLIKLWAKFVQSFHILLIPYFVSIWYKSLFYFSYSTIIIAIITGIKIFRWLSTVYGSQLTYGVCEVVDIDLWKYWWYLNRTTFGNLVMGSQSATYYSDYLYLNFTQLV